MTNSPDRRFDGEHFRVAVGTQLLKVNASTGAGVAATNVDAHQVVALSTVGERRPALQVASVPALSDSAIGALVLALLVVAFARLNGALGS